MGEKHNFLAVGDILQAMVADYGHNLEDNTEQEGEYTSCNTTNINE